MSCVHFNEPRASLNCQKCAVLTGDIKVRIHVEDTPGWNQMGYGCLGFAYSNNLKSKLMASGQMNLLH